MYLTKRLKIVPFKKGNYFVINALTGEVMLLSKSGLEALTKLRDNTEFPNQHLFKRTFKEKMFLFDSQQEEETRFLDLCNKSYKEFKDHFPIHYTFIVNTLCNFNCPYCFEPEKGRKTRNVLSKKQIKAAFELIDKKSSEQTPREKAGIEIFGGEPLLPFSKGAVESILWNVRKRDLTASIQTNGFYLSDYLNLIKEYSSSINLIQITLDGPPNIHNQRRISRSGEPTFDRLVNGIDKLLELKLPIQLNIRTNVDMDNLNFLNELMELYKTKGWTNNRNVTFVAAPVDNRCSSLKDVSKLLTWNKLFERVLPISKDTKGGVFDLSVFKALTYFRNYFSAIATGKPTTNLFIPKVVYCEAAALKLFVFHPDGQIYPCPEAVGRSELSIGTYFPDFKLYPERLLPWQDNTIFQRQQCHSCEISTFCGGGCILTALLQNGSVKKPVCEEAPEIITNYLNKIISLV